MGSSVVIGANNSSQSYTYELKLNTGNDFVVQRISTNRKKLFFISTNLRPLEFSIYPNPAADFLTVELTTDETESGSGFSTLSRTTSTTVAPYSIQIWNELQGLVRTVESTESVQLNGKLYGKYNLIFILLLGIAW